MTPEGEMQATDQITNEYVGIITTLRGLTVEVQIVGARSASSAVLVSAKPSSPWR